MREVKSRRGRDARGDPDVEHLLTVKGVAKMLSCSERTVRRMLDDGDLVKRWVRGGVRIYKSEVSEYLRKGREKT